MIEPLHCDSQSGHCGLHNGVTDLPVLGLLPVLGEVVKREQHCKQSAGRSRRCEERVERGSGLNSGGLWAIGPSGGGGCVFVVPTLHKKCKDGA